MDENRELSDRELEGVAGAGAMYDPRGKQLYCKSCGCKDLTFDHFTEGGQCIWVRCNSCGDVSGFYWK